MPSILTLSPKLWRGLDESLAPPEKLSPSQWAERNRVLSRRQSSRFGRWRNANNPALIGVMDLCVRRGVRKLNIKKNAQGGGSEALRCVLGYFATEEPDPCLLVLPDKETGKAIFAERILPLFQDTTVLHELATDFERDQKLTQVTLRNGFTLRLAWSGSAASLASHPVRIVILDEVDKMKKWVGAEADPLSLAEVRTATYANSLVVAISTPTTRHGLIHRLEENSQVRLRYFVPCPFCGASQQLRFDQLKWEKYSELAEAKHRAARVVAMDAAWYECEACGERIRDAHRAKMLAGGYWGTEDGSYKRHNDGTEDGAWPAGEEVGIQLHALHSLAPKHRHARLAADIIGADGDPAKTQNLRNSIQGTVFETQVATVAPSAFAKKSRSPLALPPKLVPAWATRLVMTADTQKDSFYFVVRAWGYGYRSARIFHGRVQSFDELRAIAFASYYPVEGAKAAPFCCHTLGIDSGGGTKTESNGSRTDEVYRFALSDVTRIKALKGASETNQAQPIRLRRVTYAPPGKTRAPYQVYLHLIDTTHFKDLLAAKVTELVPPEFDPETGEVAEAATDSERPEMWALDSNDDDDYNRQLAAEHKVLIRDAGHAPAERWVTKTAGAANHFLDAEVYQLAMAAGPANVGTLASVAEIERQRRLVKVAARPNPVTTADGRPFLVINRK